MNHIHIAINVSAGQFRQLAFVDEVIQVIVESGIDASRIKLELTESMMHSIDETRIKMEKSGSWVYDFLWMISAQDTPHCRV